MDFLRRRGRSQQRVTHTVSMMIGIPPPTDPAVMFCSSPYPVDVCSDVDDGAYSCGASSSNTNAIPTKLQVNPFDLSERISNLGYELASSAAHMPTIDRDKICGGFISVPTWACEERPWRNQAFRERGCDTYRLERSVQRRVPSLVKLVLRRI